MSNNMEPSVSKVQESSTEMQEQCAFVAGPRSWSDTRESWLARGARAAGVSFRQFKAAFYGEIDARHEIARKIAAAAYRKKIIQEAKNDAENTIGRLVALRSALAAVDPDFHGEEIARVDEALRSLGSEVCAGSFRQGD
jgi:hypothetical protein